MNNAINEIKNTMIDVWSTCHAAATSVWRSDEERAAAREAAKFASKTIQAIEENAPEHEIVGSFWFAVKEFNKFKK